MEMKPVSSGEDYFILNNESINILNSNKIFKLKKCNNIQFLLLGLFSLIILILSSIIIYLSLKNNNLSSSKNNSICPESKINMTNSQGEVYNVEDFYNEILLETNETFNKSDIYHLVDDLILGLLDSVNEPNVWNLNDSNIDNNDINNRRRLFGYTSQVGGHGGSAFILSKNNLLIKAICISSGSFIDAIEVLFSDNTWSEKKGGNGGTRTCYYFNCFTGVLVRSGSLIDALLFSNSDGTLTGYKGGGGGRASVFNFNNQCLYQISGRSGSKINAIRFWFIDKLLIQN